MMIGIDCMSLDFTQRHRAELPTFSSLLEDGATVELDSPASLLSDSVWATFLTGETPGEHGHYFPFQWHPDAQRFRRIDKPELMNRLAVTPFWQELAEYGVQTIAFDIAHVLDDSSANMLQISNWSDQRPAAPSASDPEILRQLRRRFGKRPIGVEIPSRKNRTACLRLRDRMIEAVKAKGAAIRFLMERDWQLFVTAFYEIHRAGHTLWPSQTDFSSETDPEWMLDVYRATDQELARIIDHAEGVCGAAPSITLFALHGMETNRVQDHFLPEILARLNAAYFAEMGEAKGVSRQRRSILAELRAAVPAP